MYTYIHIVICWYDCSFVVCFFVPSDHRHSYPLPPPLLLPATTPAMVVATAPADATAAAESAEKHIFTREAHSYYYHYYYD